MKRCSLILALLLCAGCVQRPNPDGPTPAPKNVAAATKAAMDRYCNGLADFYEELAAHPPKTVMDAGADAVKHDQQLREQFKRDFAEFMEPAIGSEDLDPAAAKKLFSDMAKGLRRSR